MRSAVQRLQPRVQRASILVRAPGHAVRPHEDATPDQEADAPEAAEAAQEAYELPQHARGRDLHDCWLRNEEAKTKDHVADLHVGPALLQVVRDARLPFSHAPCAVARVLPRVVQPWQRLIGHEPLLQLIRGRFHTHGSCQVVSQEALWIEVEQRLLQHPQAQARLIGAAHREILGEDSLSVCCVTRNDDAAHLRAAPKRPQSSEVELLTARAIQWLTSEPAGGVI
mmetsp:Transcript_25540/g.59436  ORF Transcript_25540/g.59436 Transcript_25540/m.59436 type:complete len:226 (+) Transcript_25540:121-798(+)